MLESLLKSLRIDPRIILFNGILFLILLQILDKLFWKPMQRHLERRRADITGAYKTVEDTRREMENLRAEYQGRLAQIESEARARIQQTVRDAQRQREEIIAQARAQAEEAMRQGEVSIAQEREETLLAMRSRLNEVAETALAKAIGVPVDDAQRRLVESYIAENVRA